METDRRTILHLVAVGRVTPAEAERLLIAWNDGREVRLALAACIAFSILAQPHFRELLPWLANAAYAVLGVCPDFLQHVPSLINHISRGMI